MKRILWIFCVLCLTLPLLASCGEGEEVMKRYDYDLSEYVTVPDPFAVRAEFEDPTVCTDEEIDEAILQVMLSYAAFTEKDGGTVERYNKVEISFTLTMDGEIQDNYSDENHELIVGYEGGGDLDYTLGEALIGKTVGDVATAEYTYPATDLEIGSWAGKTVTLSGTVGKIYQHEISECTDDFVKSFGDDSIQSVEDFRVYLENNILEAKNSFMEYAVLNAYLAGVEVKKYPEAELQAYVDKYMREVEAAATQLEMTTSEYATVYLGITEEELNESALADAKTRVKNDLACIQGSRIMGTTLTQEEYEDGLDSYYLAEGGDFASAEEFEEYYTEEIIRESVLWDKTFKQMVKNAVRVDP